MELAIFAPGQILSKYGERPELINPLPKNIVTLFGVVAWVITIIEWDIKSTVTGENLKKAMNYFALE